MACMMLPRCARSCGGASLFYCCWRSERVVRRPNPARTAVVDRTPAAPAERPAGAAAAARVDPRADRAEVAAREAARQIWSGVPAAPSLRCVNNFAPPSLQSNGGSLCPPGRIALTLAIPIHPSNLTKFLKISCPQLFPRACTSSELCVHPSCGGTAPQCNPLPDGGQCPTGWTYKAFCNTSPTPGPGCEEPPCTPAASFCVTRPASCGATVTCSCLPTNVCQSGGGCGLISGGDVICQSA